MFDCHAVEIRQIGGTYFLLLCENRNTKDDRGQWYRNGEPADWDYVNKTVVASGKTEAELLESAKRYKRLLELNWQDNFQEIVELLGTKK